MAADSDTLLMLGELGAGSPANACVSEEREEVSDWSAFGHQASSEYRPGSSGQHAGDDAFMNEPEE